MQNIYPEQVFDYFNHVVSLEKAKKIISITIARCISHVTKEIQGHNETFHCHYFKCRICRVLLFVLVERKNKKLHLLVNMNNYNIISEEKLYDNIIWR